MAPVFAHVAKFPPDPILGLTVSFLKDPRETKVNLSAGIYKTEDGKTPILSCVKEAEKFLWEEEKSKNYLPIEGDEGYLKEVARLILGDKLYKQLSSQIACAQTIGGAGALRLGADLIRQELPQSRCYLSDPTWPNHGAIFTQAGLAIETYPYYDFRKKKVDFEAMLASFSKLSPGSVVLLHACCHNPSGADLSRSEWDLLGDLCLSKGLIPFFDAAYLGFDVSFEEDAYPIRLFAHKGIEFLVAISFSKNFSLYAERVGMLMVFSKDHTSENVLSQLKKLIRRNYSNPPLHGAKVVGKILQTPDLKKKWDLELEQMRQRISSLRELFISRLAASSTKTDYSYLADKKGLFSFCDLSESQVEKLIKDYGIYMTSDGRVNVAGLNALNVDYVVKALILVGG